MTDSESDNDIVSTKITVLQINLPYNTHNERHDDGAPAHHTRESPIPESHCNPKSSHHWHPFTIDRHSTTLYRLQNGKNIPGGKNISPTGRTKRFACCNPLVWRALVVCRIGIDSVAPPIQNRALADRAVLGVLQSKEDEDETDGITSVQAGGQNIVVLGPPVKVAPTDEIVKDEAYEDPGYIVERCRGRQVGSARKDDREIEVLEETDFELFVYCPLDEGYDRANQEKVNETVVEPTVREQTLWSDDTPDN